MRDPVIDQILTNKDIYIDEVRESFSKKAYTFFAYQVMTVLIAILTFQFAVNHPHLFQSIHNEPPNINSGYGDNFKGISNVDVPLKCNELKTNLTSEFQKLSSELNTKIDSHKDSDRESMIIFKSTLNESLSLIQNDFLPPIQSGFIEFQQGLYSKIDGNYKDYKDSMILNLHDQRTNLKSDLNDIQAGFLTKRFIDDQRELKEATTTITQNLRTLFQQDIQQLKSGITSLMETHHKNYKEQISNMQSNLQLNIKQETQQVQLGISSKIEKSNNDQKKDIIDIIQTEILQSGSLLTTGELQLLKEWLNMRNLKLLYRGSRDGFGTLDFHRLCDNKGPTVTVIKSEHDKKFGGFASISWQSQEQWTRDDNAFIFSLTHRTKFHLKEDGKQFALYFRSDWGPRFGGDISIRNNCNVNSDSYSYFGWYYNLPNGIQYGSNKAYQYLSGSENFKVKEIEVFQVIY